MERQSTVIRVGRGVMFLTCLPSLVLSVTMQTSLPVLLKRRPGFLSLEGASPSIGLIGKNVQEFEWKAVFRVDKAYDCVK